MSRSMRQTSRKLKKPLTNHFDYCNAMEEVMKTRLAEQEKAKQKLTEEKSS